MSLVSSLKKKEDYRKKYFTIFTANYCLVSNEMIFTFFLLSWNLLLFPSRFEVLQNIYGWICINKNLRIEQKSVFSVNKKKMSLCKQKKIIFINWLLPFDFQSQFHFISNCENWHHQKLKLLLPNLFSPCLVLRDWISQNISQSSWKL
jgi:hypothetical protein